MLGDADKGGRLRFFRQFVEKLPIPKATEKQKETIADLVRQCLFSHGHDCEAEEGKLEALVVRLYGCGELSLSS